MNSPMKVLVLLPLLLGCSNVVKTETDTVNLRVLNNSDYDFQDVNVNGVQFGNVSKYEFSAYHEFSHAYRYGSVDLQIDDKEFRIIPIDFVGESLLENGSYTYMLSIDFESGNLILRFFEGDAIPGTIQPELDSSVLEETISYQAEGAVEIPGSGFVVAGKKITKRKINPTISTVSASRVRYVMDVSFHTINSAFVLFKVDGDGTQQWINKIKPELYLLDKPLLFDNDRDGGLLFSFKKKVQLPDQRHEEAIGVTKTDAQGMVVWSRDYDSGRISNVYDLQSTRDGGFILAGHQAGNTWLAKMDRSGNEQWQTQLIEQYRGETVVEVSGGFLVAGGKFGKIYSPPISGVTRIDVLGNELWTTRLDNALWSMIQTVDGSIVIAGSGDRSSPLLYKLDSLGTLQWLKKYPGSGAFFSLQESPDGDFLVSGVIGSHNTILKIKNTGELVWTKDMGVTSDIGSHKKSRALITEDGTILFAGSSRGRIHIAKLSLNGDWLFTKELGDK